MTATDPRSWSNVYHGQEPGRASLLASRVVVDGTAARQEPRPTGPRFMERADQRAGEPDPETSADVAVRAPMDGARIGGATWLSR